MSRLVVVAAFFVACGPPVSDEFVEAELDKAFVAANPPGRTGLEVKGHAVWLTSGFFDRECLKEKNLAFPDDPAKRPAKAKDLDRLSPTYLEQRYFVQSTEKGFCIYLGENPKLHHGAITWEGDRFHAAVQVQMERPSPWFECISVKESHPDLQGTYQGGALVIETPLALDADAQCGKPLPLGEVRPELAPPKEAAPRAPSADEVKQLAKAFDDLLWDAKHTEALAHVSCWNLLEKKVYGSCSTGEIVSAGPIPRGELRARDGTSWLENAAESIDDIGSATLDGKDRTIAHVSVKNSRTGARRTFSVQWVGGKWKILGVVQMAGEGLTTLRFLNDLDKSEQRAIFDRRVSGENIDYLGQAPVDVLGQEEFDKAQKMGELLKKQQGGN